METIDLNGIWRVASADGLYTLEMDVPGSLYDRLEQEGHFGKEGIFYRENNRRCEEVADREFLFRRSFELSADQLAADSLRLECDGLDTLATLRLNGVELGTTKNMHRRYSFDIAAAARAGTNELEISFANALAYVAREHERRRLWHVAWEQPEYQVQGFNMIRKSHCSFGWDWGPIVPDVGIWRDIRIVARDGLGFEGLRMDQNHAGEGVELSFLPEYTLYAEDDYMLEVTVTGPGGEAQTVSAPLGEELRLRVTDPRLWWPNGLGEQHLYRVDAVVSRRGERLESRGYSVGLRTLTVAREPDEWGESFTFVVNGVPFFARGADYIPEDVALPRVGRERREALIRDAAGANFNCLRVWGGGVYPSTEFFDLCDRYGLVVWQDLMFACATYDVRNPEFLSEITAEVEDNLKRIRHHASLGLICGNNEMEWGYEVWDFGPTKEQRREYLEQYQFLFPRIAAATAPQTFYWPASPSSGGDFEDPNDPNRGDCHYWDVWHGLKPFDEYEKHFFRFMSEFGFESFPSIKTVESYTAPEDRDPFSPIMEDHQRHVGGNGKILAYIASYFRYPKNLEQLIYLSQISQAEALRHGIEHWRRNRGRCMGAVYWQLNDNWPVASWSSIDYYGRWKALHYTAKHSFANLLLSTAPVEGGAALHLSNESRDPVAGTLAWRYIALDGTLLETGECEASVDSLSSGELCRVDLAAHLAGAGARRGVLEARFTPTRGEVVRTLRCFVPCKSLELRDPGLGWAVAEEEGELVIELSVERPALFVWLDFGERDRVFSDNGIHLLPGETRRIRVPLEGEAVESLAADLRVMHLHQASLAGLE